MKVLLLFYKIILSHKRQSQSQERDFANFSAPLSRFLFHTFLLSSIIYYLFYTQTLTIFNLISHLSNLPILYINKTSHVLSLLLSLSPFPHRNSTCAFLLLPWAKALPLSSFLLPYSSNQPSHSPKSIQIFSRPISSLTRLSLTH